MYITGLCTKNFKNKYGHFQRNEKCAFTDTFCKCNFWIRIFFAVHLHTSKNLDYRYWSELRFLKGDKCRLFEVFDIPEEISCYNQSKFSGLGVFYVFLKCFAYPCCYFDLVPRFRRPVLEYTWCQTILWICCMKIFIILYIALINLC